MDILAVFPLGNGSFVVRRQCGYYLDNRGHTERLDTEPAHELIIGKIPASEVRKGSTASGQIEVK